MEAVEKYVCIRLQIQNKIYVYNYRCMYTIANENRCMYTITASRAFQLHCVTAVFLGIISQSDAAAVLYISI